MGNGNLGSQEIDLTKITGWKDLIVKWLFQQGVSTILLIFVLAGLYWGVPKWVDSINAADDEAQARFEKDLDKILSFQDKQQALNRELFRELLKEQKATKEAVKEASEKAEEKRDRDF